MDALPESISDHYDSDKDPQCEPMAEDLDISDEESRWSFDIQDGPSTRTENVHQMGETEEHNRRKSRK